MCLTSDVARKRTYADFCRRAARKGWSDERTARAWLFAQRKRRIAAGQMHADDHVRPQHAWNAAFPYVG